MLSLCPRLSAADAASMEQPGAGEDANVEAKLLQAIQTSATAAEQRSLALDAARVADSQALRQQVVAQQATLDSILQQMQSLPPPAPNPAQPQPPGGASHIKLDVLLDYQKWEEMVLTANDLAIDHALSTRFEPLMRAPSGRHTTAEAEPLLASLRRMTPALRRASTSQNVPLGEVVLEEIAASLTRLNTLHFGYWCSEKEKSSGVSSMDIFSDSVELDQLPLELRKKWDDAQKEWKAGRKTGGGGGYKQKQYTQQTQQQQQQPQQQPQYQQRQGNKGNFRVSGKGNKGHK